VTWKDEKGLIKNKNGSTGKSQELVIKKTGGGGEIFRTRPDRPWGLPSLLYSENRVSFPEVKRPARGVDHPPSSSAEVKERVELYLYSPSGPSWPVLGRTLPCLFTCWLNSTKVNNNYNNGWRIHTSRLLIMLFSPDYCHLLPLGSIYSPRHHFFSKIWNLCSSLNVWDQVLHP
jgi:hypothetical protein